MRWKLAVAAAAAAWFAVRGPVRGASRSTDFAVVYAGARVWADGGNPYDPAALDAAWQAAGGGEFRPGGRTAVYPPSAFVLAAPIARLPWPTARTLWLALCVAGYLAVMAAAARAAECREPLYFAWALAYAPACTAVSLGQPSMPALGLMALASLPRRWGVPSGIALGLAVALKPQLGGVFVLYALCRRRWQCVAAAATVAAATLLAGALRLEAAGVPWRQSLALNLAALAEHEGGVGRGNPLRHDVIHLAAPLHALGIPESAAGALAALAVGAALLFAFVPRRTESDRDPAALALLAALLPLPVYHRIYDASVHAFVIAWAFSRKRWLPLALLAPLLVPGAAWLHERWGEFVPGSAEWRFLAIHPAWLASALPLAVWWSSRADPPTDRMVSQMRRNRR